MENKIALIADTHFGAKNHNKGVFGSSMLFFEKQFFPYCLENNVKDVFHLGDLVHNRNVIDLWILQELKTRFFKWFDDNDVKLHCLIGNHCSYFRSTIDHSFQQENLNEFKNCITYSEPKIIELGKYTFGVVPWICDVDNFTPPKNVDILLGHFEMSDFPMMKNVFSRSGFDYTIFKDYKYVFSGHYHTKSTRDNVHYVGTQYQLTWNDYAEDKGFYVLKDNYELEYISNAVCPRFVKIFYNDVTNTLKQVGLDSSELVTKDFALNVAKSNYVRLYIEKATNQLELDNFYTSLSLVSCNSYKIEIVNLEEIIEDYEFDGINDVEEETIDIIIKYIENMTFEKSISAATLIEMSKNLYKDACDESISVGDE